MDEQNTSEVKFFERVYEAVKRIPRGSVASYGQIATALGYPRMSREVGWALHVNPQPGVIPCHRVVDIMGNCAKTFAFGGIDVQRAMLEAEGVIFDDNGKVKKEYFVKKLTRSI
ncbi:MGMT family protein [bacterium]|nr:MGMT family protein [bacterium]